MTNTLLTANTLYKPFLHPWAVEMWDDHEDMHWTKKEVSLNDDVSDWKNNKLTDSEKNFVTQILRMFTQQDFLVGGFYYDYLIPAFKNNEIRMMLGTFANREATHQNAYALLNDTLGLPEGDYAAFLKYTEMKEKVEFATKVDTSTIRGLAHALTRSTQNEGVSLFASFVMLLNFQRRGLMKGMGKIVEWSIRDETQHVLGITKLFRLLCDEHPNIVNNVFKKRVYEDFKTTVQLEDAFIDLAYEMGPVEGLPINDVKQYIRFIADRRLSQLGLKEIWEIKENPVPWLDWIINGTQHTNFFENKVADYVVAGLQGNISYDKKNSFVIYTKHGCPFCAKAKKLMIENGMDFEEHDLSNVEERQKWYDEHNFKDKERTVPKIWTSAGEFIGGCTDFQKKYNF